ncbi:class I SAM-dependent methyltransferase [Myroides sp. M-43]|uniref:class I SAM-dependent methyltransferase n=1 Tax=Myroides oncorhynchi TaxID=2893756 RepID=UPI001E2E80E1|nr:class I SAM-dependent methyltransferase [Myroides oncorhynchi]MCC9041584.1 class I SAM-dependent methyltransferase [Myroides oncorhynchi]
MEQQDNIELAKQLRCPNGDDGVKVGNTMYASNSNMIYKTIDRLNIKAGMQILELGFGNGRHLPYLFSKEKNINYSGIELSDVMLSEAIEFNKELIKLHKIVFGLGDDSGKIAFEDKSIDNCFSINTIYFWEEPNKYFQEVYRILKSEGQLTLAFIQKDFIQKQPFVTSEVFHFHKTEWLIRLLTNIGFYNIEQWQYMENTTDKLGKPVVRPFVILKATKL